MGFKTIEWLENGTLRLIDQRVLPLETVYNDYTTPEAVAEAIHAMVTRGAPAIGASAAYGLALTTYHTKAADIDTARQELEAAYQVLRQSRPTAVNLFWALDRVMNRVTKENPASVQSLHEIVLDEAHAIAREDVETNKAIGMNALPLVPQKATFVHHCNTGSLATVDYGTALGIIRTAHENGREVLVFVDETRPRLQGARLTSWELKQQGIPHKVIADGASGHYMRRHGVDLCVVGADRVAANGDTANKIGTYNLAVVAKANGVPFYVAAPTSTIDMSTSTGDDIEIEERTPLEVTHVGETQITPDGVDVGNPAFDVTPAEYITAIVTEKGVIYPPFTENLKKLFKG